MRPLLVGIGGGGSSSGKTTLGCHILRRLNGIWGALKYTKTALYTKIVKDPSVLRQRDKDTARLLEAGAVEALWVQAPRDGLEDTIKEALGMFSPLDGIIIEGNSAIEVLSPDIVIFIFRGEIKPGSERVLEQADIVVGDRELKRNGFFYIEEMEKVAEFVSTTILKEMIKNEINASAPEGRLTCKMAQEIAKKLNIEPKEVGRAANALGIKIINCQLGCFK